MTTSVVLSCYNGEKFIIEQLESILNQTQQPDEVIISDDCSDDNTFECVENFIKDNNLTTWHIYKNKINQGWKKNFAALILKAKCDVVFLCDQDDIWYRDKIKHTVDAMEKNPQDVLVVSDLDIKYMTENSSYIPESLGDKEYQRIKLKARWLYIMRPGCAFAVRRDFAQKCFKNYWNEKLAHDMLLWQAAFFVDKIGYLNKKLFVFRRFAESTTNNKYKTKIEARKAQNEVMLDTLDAVLLMERDNEIEISAVAMKKLKRMVTLETYRKDFIETKNIISWIKCVKYLDCYWFKRSFIADLLYVYKER